MSIPQSTTAAVRVGMVTREIGGYTVGHVGFDLTEDRTVITRPKLCSRAMCFAR